MRKFLSVTLIPFSLGLLLLAGGRWITPQASAANWWPGIVTNAGVVFVSIALTELILNYFRQWIPEKDQEAFGKFFGVHRSSDPGDILIQADQVDKILEPLFADSNSVSRALNQPFISNRIANRTSNRQSSGPFANATNRLYKARLWINAHDTDGAREIRDAFRKVGFHAPELKIAGHGSVYTNKQAPYVICMGLGFTDETINLIAEAGEGWMKINHSTKNGDAILLHDSIFPYANRDELENGAREGDYVELFPKDWSHAGYLDCQHELYTEARADRTAGKPPKKSNDYAVILRYTDTSSERSKIWIVVAGFTAHGTAAAARYLAANWKALFKKYVDGKHSEGGDFCEILAGNSADPASWKRAKKTPSLTPEYLESENIVGRWTERYKDQYRSRASGR